MEKLYKCMNCGKEYRDFKTKEGYNMTKCKECYKESLKKEKEVIQMLQLARTKEKDFRVKEKRKLLKGKDPYEVLAHLKIMLQRSKTRNRQTPQGWWVSPHDSDAKESILQECYDILEAYDIPSKYLIAETLDSKD